MRALYGVGRVGGVERQSDEGMRTCPSSGHTKCAKERRLVVKGGGDFQTIQEAIDHANEGDTVRC